MYPEEESKKSSSKLQSKPGGDINITITVVYPSDGVSVVVENHSQRAEEQDTEKRCLETKELTKITKEISMLRYAFVLGMWHWTVRIR